MQRHGVQYTLWRPIGRLGSIREQTEQLMERLRLKARRDAPAGALSYSEQRSLEIGMTLASDPKMILLDEPMAGMSQEETDYTKSLILELTRERTLLIVEHDMQIVFSLSDRVSVLVYGEVIASGPPAQIRNDRRVQEAYLGEEVRA
jgi:branched-chain amino acid transport system ATP-binding protein